MLTVIFSSILTDFHFTVQRTRTVLYSIQYSKVINSNVILVYLQVDALVTAEERAEAARIRAAEEHSEGDPVAEAAILPCLLDPELSPLFVDSFEDMPSTYVVTCGLDAIRDDGLLYARRMRRSGLVKVAHKYYPKHQHGFMSLIPNNELQHDLSNFLAKNQGFF